MCAGSALIEIGGVGGCRRERWGGSGVCKGKQGANLRVLVHEAARIVHLVVHYNVEIFLCVVLRHVRVGELLVGHCDV